MEKTPEAYLLLKINILRRDKEIRTVELLTVSRFHKDWNMVWVLEGGSAQV